MKISKSSIMNGALLFIATLVLSAATAHAQHLVSDKLFGNNGQVASTPIGGAGQSTNILRQPDNKILLCGNIYESECNCSYNLMLRIDCAGNIDSTFGVNGIVKHTFDQRNSGADYVLQPDGKILVAGVQASNNGSSQHHPTISRYNYNGTVDTTFGTMGTNKLTAYPGSSTFYSMFLLPDGKILCSGQQGYGNHLIIRFDSTGTVDTAFGNSGAIRHATPPGMSLLNGFTSVMRGDGKIISATSGFFDQLLVLGAYDTLGVEDSTFGVKGYMTDNNFSLSGYIPRILLQSNDKIIVAKQNPTETEIKIARYNTNGSIDTSFGNNGYVSIAGARLENLFKLDNDDFILGYLIHGIGSTYKKYNANGIEITPFSLNGANTFGFSASKADIGIASTNNEFILASSYGGIAMAKFVETITPAPSITQSGNTLSSNVTNSGASYQWFLDGNEIPDATNSSLDVTQNGTYTVIVANSWGCESSDDLEVLFTGIQHPNPIDGISVFPNPVKDDLMVRNFKAETLTLKVYDLKGQLLAESKTSSTNHILPLGNLAKGTYVLEVNTKNKISRHKIIKR